MTGSLSLRASAGAEVHVSSHGATSDPGTTCSRTGDALHFGRNTLFHAQEDVRADGLVAPAFVAFLPGERVYSIEIRDASVIIDDAACLAETLLVSTNAAGSLLMDATVSLTTRIVYV